MTANPHSSPVHIVWFKRDLRLHDHTPLQHAAERGAVLPLYIIEPTLWNQPDAAERQWQFVRESLQELNAQLAALGQPLIVRIGQAETIFAELAHTFRVQAVWSHQETGNGWTFARDRRVAACLQTIGIPWHEYRQHGVERGTSIDRNGWAKRWQQLMSQAVSTAPLRLPRVLDEPLALPPSPIVWRAEQAIACPGRQRGGRKIGVELLDSFLQQRGRSYAKAMSAPQSAQYHCSRLSAHFAYGTLSIREVFQAVQQRRAALDLLPPDEIRGWPRALAAFEGRLHWHCHFMQKLESEPRLEFQNLHRGFEGLRPLTPDPERSTRWQNGETGWPFVDACMRALRAQGWINFRMRAMLMAVSSYHLWQHWREPALHLARLFTDYEPGIHFPQAQMQSGTTGMNTLRIYNPIKQSLDLDPEGHFIRRWLPELASLPADWIHTPWLLTPLQQAHFGVVLDRDYPVPLIDHEQAARAAREKITAWRRTHLYAAETERVITQHASRKPGQATRSSTKKIAANSSAHAGSKRMTKTAASNASKQRDLFE